MKLNKLFITFTRDENVNLLEAMWLIIDIDKIRVKNIDLSYIRCKHYDGVMVFQ